MNDIKFYTLTFDSKIHEYDDIFTLRFSSEEPLPFIAGQWLHLGFPSENKDKSKVRHMSVASAPDDKFIEFSMDLNSDSWYKKHIAGLKPGDQMRAFKIKGDFVVNPEVKNEVVFLSGGIGITPVRSIIRDMQNKKATVNWSLAHVSRDGFLYENELAKLPNKQWHVNHSGFGNIWSDIVSKPSDTQYYLSGSDRFVVGVRNELIKSGIETERIVTESFM